MNLLFITHEANRTGAPIMLLELLKWITQKTSDIEVSVLALRDGNLRSDFEKNCTNYYSFEEEIKQERPSLFDRIALKLFGNRKSSNRKLFLNSLQTEGFTVVYANTVVSLSLACEIKEQSDIKIIGHIHELPTIIEFMVPRFKKMIPEIDQFIAASNLVEANLIERYRIKKERITRIYECSKVDGNKNSDKKRDKFLVGASGEAHWRKGSDVFIQVARYLKAHYPELEVEFQWVGKLSRVEKLIIDEDLKKLKLNNVHFVGEITNPYDYYKNFDVFLMTSREDPFPLVCIEVGLLGKPIILFEGATGTQEIVEKGGGFIVPYLNVEAMAEKIVNYYQNPKLIQKHGAVNAVEFQNFSPDKICPQIFEVIKNVIS